MSSSRFALAACLSTALLVAASPAAMGLPPIVGEPGGSPVNATNQAFCHPYSGTAHTIDVVVGWKDQGTYTMGVNGEHKASGATPICKFSLRFRTDQAQFTGPPGLGTLGGASNPTESPCFAPYGGTCSASGSFTWWRAAHGVSFTVPYEITVNDVVVAKGTYRFYDPPVEHEVEVNL